MVSKSRTKKSGIVERERERERVEVLSHSFYQAKTLPAEAARASPIDFYF